MIFRKNSVVTIAFSAGLITLFVYLHALSCGFINLDDPFYVTNNPLIKRLDIDALRRIFTESHLGAWLPLTYLSFAIDYHFWGDNPFGYHLTNILLHSANSVLVVLIAGRLLRNKGVGGTDAGGYTYPMMLLLSGLLWSVHPLRVESVAWVAERKDVLNGLFAFASVLFYLGYTERKAEGERRLIKYLMSLAFFSLSLLAKQSSVTLPLVLLIIDWYPGKRISRANVLPILLEKIPFLVVSLLISLMTIYFAATAKMLSSMQDLPLYIRVLVSGNAVFEYVRLSLFPVDIIPYFLLPKPLPYSYLVNTLIVASVTLYVFSSRRCCDGLKAAWLTFIILLLPVLAFVQAGDDIAIAARYTYLPAAALCIAAAAAVTRFSSKLRLNGFRYLSATLFTVSVGFIALNIATTFRLINVWENTATFWSRVIEIQPVGRAFADRGVYYLITGKSAAAVNDFTVAIQIAEKSGLLKKAYNLYAFRGVALSDVGRHSKAVDDFNRAIELNPHPTYYQQRGLALQTLGRAVEAAEDLRRAGPNPPPIDWFE